MMFYSKFNAVSSDYNNRTDYSCDKACPYEKHYVPDAAASGGTELFAAPCLTSIVTLIIIVDIVCDKTCSEIPFVADGACCA